MENAIKKEPDDIQRFINFLENKGFEVLIMGGKCPFQIEAENPEKSLCFYFRARGEIASLQFFNQSGQYLDDGTLDFDDNYLIAESLIKGWDYCKAGWITPNEACYTLCLLWQDIKDFLD